MVFKGAACFNDKFGLLGCNAAKNATRFVAPEALFNLDNAGSCKTIHNRHKTGVKTAKKVLDLTGNERDSSSHTSSSSDEGSDSGGEGSRSKKSPKSDEIDVMSTTGSR